MVRTSGTFGISQAARRASAAARFAVFAALFSALVSVSAPVTAQSANDALFKAVELNDMAAVDKAIKDGAQLSAKNAAGMTAADVAVDLGHFRIAHALLAYRNGGSQQGPRVSDNVRAAITSPSNRIRANTQNQAGQTAPTQQGPDPRLAEIDPPRKPAAPAKPPAPAAPAGPPSMDLPALGAPGTDMTAPAPSEKEPVPGMPAEIPMQAEKAPPPPTRPRAAEPPKKEEGGLFDSVLGGLKSVVTLGGLIGGQDEETPSQPSAADSAPLLSPADRFSSSPSQPSESESSAGRMVDRMTESVLGAKQKENEFGLPKQPVLPPLGTPGDLPPLASPGDLPPLAPAGPQAPLAAPDNLPPLDMPGMGAPVESAERPPDAMSQPPLDIPVVPPSSTGGSDIPGLVPPVDAPSGMSVTPPADTQAELLPPELPPSSSTDVPGLPPGLDIPGLSPAPAAPARDEVPGIIPPPADNADSIPSLPPGLEPLPGSDTGQLRRPGGLVQPEDPTSLPAPGSEDLRARIQRLDDILRRAPDQIDRYRTGIGTPPASSGVPRPSPTTPVAPAPTEQMRPGTDTRGDIRDPEKILRKTREAARMRENLERTAPSSRLTSKLGDGKVEELPTPHALRPEGVVVTEREDSTSRLMDRLSGMTDRKYPNEDVHGLPVVKPSADGTTPPRKSVDVAELPESRKEKTDDKIHALARFFRGDQEHEAGMQPPPEVKQAPLPQVIDNMVPENDPSRGKVVDDRLLDLRGVENEPPSYRGQAGATSTDTGSLNPNFLDRLNTVLGPKQGNRSVEQELPPPPPGKVGLNDLDVPQDQIVPKPAPNLPDPWTMTIEKSDAEGNSRTLGVSAISPEDGSEMQTEQGVVTKMVGRIRELLSGPDGARGPDVTTLDDKERQDTAEQLLSEALRDGAPTALPDQNQWPVTEVESGDAVPGVPPPPRTGVLTRTSLTDVVLSLGESVTLENTLPPQQDGIDPLNECIKKNRGTTLFCVEPVDWPSDLQPMFMVPTILYTGPMAITRYDQGSPSRFHALFDANEFEDVVAYYQARYGEPTEIWKRSIAPLAQPRQDNPTVSWRSRDTRTNIITVLEIRKFDDSRGGFPDTQRGAVMLYHLNAPSIFPQVSSHELMRLRRTR